MKRLNWRFDTMSEVFEMLGAKMLISFSASSEAKCSRLQTTIKSFINFCRMEIYQQFLYFPSSTNALKFLLSGFPRSSISSHLLLFKAQQRKP